MRTCCFTGFAAPLRLSNRLCRIHSKVIVVPFRPPVVTSRCNALSNAAKAKIHNRRGRHCRGTVQIRAGVTVAEPTVTQLFAKLLGYCVVLGSFTRSVPQIMRILKNKSVEGISLAAQYAELVAYSITVAYNCDHGYAFSTYGDTAACWVQDVILILLIARYRNGLWRQTFLSAIVIGAGCWALMSGAIDRQALAVLQASTILIISLGGRIPQIVLNYQRGNSGELSPVTSGLNLAGNLARTFTTLVLTQDLINLMGTLVQAFLNGILVWQSVSTARQAAGKEPPPDLAFQAKAA